MLKRLRGCFLSRFDLAVCSLCLVLMHSGCNQSVTSETASNTSSNAPKGLPTVSIPPQQNGDEFEQGLDDQQLPNERLPEPDAGTPEWNLKQIALKRTMITTLGKDEMATIEKSHHEIIDLAKGAIAMTHKIPEKQRIFDAACHALTESRLHLAFSGHQEQVTSLYDDAEAQLKRDPTSISSANSTFAIVRLAEHFATKHAQAGPANEADKWAKEYSRSIKHFVIKYPAEESRGAVALLNVGKFCESRKDTAGAVECYSLLASSFPQSPFSSQVTGIVRRLTLEGKIVELGGPTIDGGHVSMKDYVGKPVLIIFWDSQSKEFTAQVDQLIAYLKSPQGEKLAVLGVNLDQGELEVDRFLEAHPIPGRQIFPLEPEQRRFNSPISKYYAIRSTPQYWLVSKEGKLLSSQLTLQQLPAAVNSLEAR